MGVILLVTLVVASVLYTLTGKLVDAFGNMARKLGLVRSNYGSRPVATGAGVGLLIPLVAVVMFMAVLGLLTPLQALSGSAALAFLAIGGLLDDVSSVLGHEGIKGWRGHLGTFVYTGRMTTGFWKILFGGLAGVMTALAVDGLYAMVEAALLVPLAANTLNLLDLRPGRTGKFFTVLLVLSAGVLAITTQTSRMPLLAIVVTTMATVGAYLRFDLAEKVMLGDTGANVLGGFLGVFVAFFGTSLLRLPLLAVFFATQIVTERVSISTIIQNAALLRWVDSLGRSPGEEKSEATGHEQEEHGVRQRI